MKRPYVQAKGTNIKKDLRNELLKHLPLFKQYDGLAGIMLDGGISRGFADTLSEIDVVLFLHQKSFDHYKTALTPTALGITTIDHYLYDIKLCCYEKEMNHTYQQLELWDLSYAEILYDPNDELTSLFEEKLKSTVDYSSAGSYLFNAWWNYRLATDIWIAREDIAQGHYMLNAALTPLLSALYIINKEYIPHEKWIIHMSRSLCWLPENYEQQLEQLLCVKDGTLTNLIARQAAFHNLWIQLDHKLCTLTLCPNGISLMQKNSYTSLYALYEKGEVSVSEWLKCHTINELNYDPFNKLATLDGERIKFNYDKLELITEKDMYSWFYELVEALKKHR